MKLISLSIENFGKLHHYDLTLQDGLNTICEENGWGKSTLAAFLKAMFYGLPKSTKRELDQNDYKHYTPWQGGFFGGNLVFSCKKGTFRIERAFGESESFALYDVATGLPTTVFSESLGDELFGIDSEGFEQSVFLSARALTPKDGNGTVQAKLTGIDEIHDLSNYESAFNLLDNRAKDYKKRGGAGYIGDTEERIREIRAALAESRGKLHQQETFERELAEIQAGIAETTAKEKSLQQSLLRAKLVSEIRAFKGKLDELSRQKEKIDRRFSGKIPTREELSDCRKKIDQAEAMRTELATVGFDATEQAELISLSNRFPTGAPSAETLNEKLQAASALRSEQAGIRQALQTAQNDLQFAEERLASLPLPEELTRAKQLIAGEKSAVKTSKSPILTFFFILSLLLLPAGTAMLIVGILRLVLPLIIGGTCALALGVFFLLSHVLLVGQKKRVQAMEQAEFANELTILLQRFDLPEQQDHAASVALLCAQRKDTESARDEAFAKCESLKREQQQCQKKADDLQNYLASFGVSEPDPESGLFALLELSRNWESLLKKQKAAALTEKQKKATLASAANEVQVFLARCSGLDLQIPAKENFFAMEELLTSRETLMRMIADRQEELQEKLAELGIAEPALLEHEPDLAALAEQQKELDEIHARLKENENRVTAQLSRWSAETELIPEREEELTRLEELLAEQKKRYALLAKTRDLLKQAHDDLTTRYLEPTRQNFAKYLTLLCGKNVPKATLDAKFNVTVLDSGMSRQMESYSRGWRDLLQFCVRLSLIDALYASGGESPFLLLDDPFTNLDEERLAAAKDLLAELAKSRQILYLVCHGDRV